MCGDCKPNVTTKAPFPTDLGLFPTALGVLASLPLRVCHAPLASPPRCPFASACHALPRASGLLASRCCGAGGVESRGACESASLSSNAHALRSYMRAPHEKLRQRGCKPIAQDCAHARMNEGFASIRHMVSFPAHLQTSRDASCTKSSSTLPHWHHARFHLIPVFAKKTLAGGFPGNSFSSPPHPPMSMLAVGRRGGLTVSSVFFAARIHSQASPRINIDIGGLGGALLKRKPGERCFFANTGISAVVTSAGERVECG